MSAARHILVVVLMASIAGAAAPPAQPVTTKPSGDDPVLRALVFLSRHQNEDGSFDAAGPKVAVTGLCLMSFLASGHAPDVGKYGAEVRAAADYLVKSIPEDGYVGRVDGSRMYGQGIVTLALAEVYGAESSEENRTRVRGALIKTVKVILDAQNAKKLEGQAGGWRYEPQSADSDLSLSAWNALALRACRDIGMDVPKEPIDRAIAYILRCYRPEQHGFSYQPAGEASASMTGVGVLSLYLLENKPRAEMTSSSRLLVDTPVTENTKYAYYAAYYVTQAAHRSGPDVWDSVWRRTRDLLAEKQSDDGGWPASRTGDEPGRNYATAMAVLTLSVPQGLLPIYQR